jgi:hypothetical protein
MIDVAWSSPLLVQADAAQAQDDVRFQGVS